MTSFRKVLPKLVWTFLVRSPKDGELLDLEWGMALQVSNTILDLPHYVLGLNDRT